MVEKIKMKTRMGMKNGTRKSQRKGESDSDEGGGPVTGTGAVGSVPVGLERASRVTAASVAMT